MDQSFDYQQPPTINPAQHSAQNSLQATLLTGSPLPDNNTMDQSLDHSPAGDSDDSAMDECLDQQPGFDTPNDAEDLTSIEKSLEAPTSRRSTRLASKEEPLRSNRYQSSSAVKRKAPTGEAGAKKSLFSGGSRASPIDVDALQAVFEKHPVKLEPQVCARRFLNRDKSD
jgi:hypothetical protein